ncbi:MAG: flagellar FliJ family protein, partial [Veillonella sp.]|nr:flagellar FliJ family protein [Veillonella sp.]
KLWKKSLALVALTGSLAVGTAMASDFNEVVPADNWTYEAVQTLVKHGALKDTMGLDLSAGKTYTRAQLAPLMAYITEHREQMNDNDKDMALKLYREYQDEVMAYNVAKTKREKALKKQEQDRKALEKKLAKNRTKEEKEAAKQAAKEEKARQKAAKKAGKTAGLATPATEGAAAQMESHADGTAGTVANGQDSATATTTTTTTIKTAPKTAPKVMNDVYYGAVNPPAELQPIAPPDAAEEVDYDNEKPEEMALTPEQIQEKMKHFKIDTSPLRVSGDVRVRTQGKKGGKAKSDAKASVEMAMTL